MKKFKFVLLLPLILFSFGKLNAQVTIGSANPPSEMALLNLDASINPKALHLPRLTEASRDALVASDSAPADQELAVGLMIFNIETQCLEFWNGQTWISLCDESSSGNFP